METVQVTQLLRPAAFSHVARQIELRETHISWVILTGSFAYKIRKPVRFDFVDQTSVAAREFLCTEELRLNQRLAADLYLGMVPVRLGADGLANLRDDGVTLDHAVKMRQFDARDELPSMLAHGTVTREHVADLGARLAAFHREAAVADPGSPFGTPRTIHDTISANLRTLLEHAGAADDPGALARLGDWTRKTLAYLAPRFAERHRQGFIRECHGDLHGRNIAWWQGRLTPFDALEFDPALRWIDSIDDIAFVFMDLLAREHADLAHVLLDAYLEAGGDYAGLRLMRFYAVYRALVRAKVDGLQRDGTSAVPLRQELQDRKQKRLRVALAMIASPKPALLLMHGLPGSGKTWLSGQLIGRLPAVRIRSDIERKRLFGLAAGEHSHSGLDSGLYGQAATEQTYAHVLDGARAALEGGFTVIVDAAFHDTQQRRQFRQLACDLACPFVILHCDAAEDVLTERVAAREARGDDASEAGLGVLRARIAQGSTLASDDEPFVIRVDTGSMTSTDALLPVLARRIAG